MWTRTEICWAYRRYETMTDYTAIDCALYCKYESAILQRRRLRLSWHQPGGQLHVEVAKPVDLETRDQAKFLLAEARGRNRLELRLEQILKTEAL
jgi:transcriptional antiterminator Rof (Rho-off)